MSNFAKLCLLALVFCLLFGLSCGVDKGLAGSGTETGNVTGTVVTKALKNVAGAKVSLFKKKSEITSPDETSNPVDEAYTNDTGYFSFKAENGNYTVIASSDSEYAFRDNIIPGTDSAKHMRVVLDHPGAIKGEIVNSLELRGTGSVVVHLIGTAIFQNVNSDGTFRMSDVPAGKYTLVSYSTYQPEFSPNYQQVAVYPDSVTNLGQYSLAYNGIPIPKNIKVSYDTAHQVVKVLWNSIKNYSDFQEYAVLRGQADLPDHNLKQIAHTQDTVYLDSIKFTSEQPMQYEYCVLIHNKLGDAGKYFGIYSVDIMPYQTTIPKIDTIKAVFDTANGIVNLSWDSVATFDGFDGYLLVRSITNASESKNRIDTIGMIKKTLYADSLFKKTLSFSDSNTWVVSYSICAHRKDWNLYGRISFTKSLNIVPYYTKVPVIDSLAIKYDTLKGTLGVSWDSLKNFSELEGYLVTREISNSAAGIDKRDTFMVKNAASFIDTIYPKYVAFSALTGTTVTYGISVKHKTWGITGGILVNNSTIFSYKCYRPVVSAGPDQNVDISSDVLLQGTVVSSAWPIAKMEWKAGDGSWTKADSGKATFTTNSNYNTETIVCIFRATDSAGNVGLDTMNVVKQQLVVTFGNFPSKTLPFQGTSTVGISGAFNAGNFWIIGDIEYGKYAVWSTKDFNSWTVENSSPGMKNRGQIVYFKGKLFSFGFSSFQKSYRSNDGVSWEEITPDLWDSVKNLPYDPFLNICVFNDRLFVICQSGNWISYSSALYTSEDGVTWTRVGLSMSTARRGFFATYGQKLYFAFDNSRLSSSDNGLTWTDAPMWDQDYSTFPDECYQLIGNDSVLVAYYNERPAGVRKASMFRNGIWTNVPIGGLGLSSNYYNIFFLFKNRLMYVNQNNYTIQSIKLY